jgi:hypothetical protein
MGSRVEALLIVVTLAFTSSAAWRLRSEPGSGSAVPSNRDIRRSPPLGPSDDSLDALAQSVIDRDPFRIARAPASLPYAQGSSEAPPTPAVRPNFVLRGIIGPPWMAILDGIPGAPSGSVVQSGATFERIVIKRITRDSVVIQGADTTWRLAIFRGPGGA